jgi:hypothetical protein
MAQRRFRQAILLLSDWSSGGAVLNFGRNSYPYLSFIFTWIVRIHGVDSVQILESEVSSDSDPGDALVALRKVNHQSK